MASGALDPIGSACRATHRTLLAACGAILLFVLGLEARPAGEVDAIRFLAEEGVGAAYDIYLEDEFELQNTAIESGLVDDLSDGLNAALGGLDPQHRAEARRKTRREVRIPERPAFSSDGRLREVIGMVQGEVAWTCSIPDVDELVSLIEAPLKSHRESSDDGMSGEITIRYETHDGQEGRFLVVKDDAGCQIGSDAVVPFRDVVRRCESLLEFVDAGRLVDAELSLSADARARLEDFALQFDQVGRTPADFELAIGDRYIQDYPLAKAVRLLDGDQTRADDLGTFSVFSFRTPGRDVVWIGPGVILVLLMILAAQLLHLASRFGPGTSLSGNVAWTHFMPLRYSVPFGLATFVAAPVATLLFLQDRLMSAAPWSTGLPTPFLASVPVVGAAALLAMILVVRRQDDFSGPLATAVHAVLGTRGRLCGRVSADIPVELCRALLAVRKRGARGSLILHGEIDPGVEPLRTLVDGWGRADVRIDRDHELGIVADLLLDSRRSVVVGTDADVAVHEPDSARRFRAAVEDRGDAVVIHVEAFERHLEHAVPLDAGDS